MPSLLNCPSFGSPQQQQQHQTKCQQVPSGDITTSQHEKTKATNGLKCEAEDLNEKDKLKDIELSKFHFVFVVLKTHWFRLSEGILSLSAQAKIFF